MSQNVSVIVQLTLITAVVLLRLYCKVSDILEDDREAENRARQQALLAEASAYIKKHEYYYAREDKQEW